MSDYPWWWHADLMQVPGSPCTGERPSTADLPEAVSRPAADRAPAVKRPHRRAAATDRGAAGSSSGSGSSSSSGGSGNEGGRSGNEAGRGLGADESAVQALMLASRAFVGLTLRSLASVGVDVTLPQFRTLVVLAVRGPQRSSDIAEELGVNPSTGTRMCERLVRKGLIFRMPDPGDRRVVRLGLTRSGQDVVDRVLAARRAELVRIVAATAGTWQPAVTETLTAFAAAAGEVGEPDWWLGWSASAEPS
ncbi:MarR family winged helix-turn-helix transcriptional regulator [Actinoplanes palleronii]|nr:MarR family transcriptional regulator [Actinoplanes palleronii]